MKLGRRLGTLFQKFWHGVKEWFADAADHIQLFCLEQQIEFLNEKLEWEAIRIKGKTSSASWISFVGHTTRFCPV